MSAAVLAGILVAVDVRMKSTTAAGFALRDAEWTLCADDFPEAWRGFESSAIFSRVSAEAPEVHPRIGVWMRRTTGVRWTPSRWRLWFGSPAIVSMRRGEFCASVHPGLLARTALFLASEAPGTEGGEGLVHVGGLYFGLRDGFLLVGSAAGLVEELLHAGELRAFSTGPNSIAFDFSGDPAIHGVTTMKEEVGLSIKVAGERGLTPLRREYLAVDWAAPPILSVQVRDTRFWSRLIPETWPEFPASHELEKAWRDFESLLPPGWNANADSLQAALISVDVFEAVPVPELAMVVRSETPATPLTAPANAVPYEWAGEKGWMTPYLGEDASLFVAPGDRFRMFTNQERTMSRLMARERIGRVESLDAVIEVDGKRLGGLLRDLALNAAADELWPERDRDDVEREVVPWLNALSAAGELRLEGNYADGGVTLHGVTRPPDHAAVRAK
jgi:hypothetical protein